MTTRLSIASLLLLFSALALSQQPPSTDPFYTPSDSNWRTTDPGTILAHRLVPRPLKNVTYQSAYQLLYRTTDSLGEPIPAVTTVIRPRGDVNTSRLLSYQIIYDTAEVDCSPSYVLQQGGLNAFDNGFTYGLSAGVMVNSPDYEGPKAAFTAGKVAGQATLDSIRAALASKEITGVEQDATVAMWGYSGGVSRFLISSVFSFSFVLGEVGPVQVLHRVIFSQPARLWVAQKAPYIPIPSASRSLCMQSWSTPTLSS